MRYTWGVPVDHPYFRSGVGIRLAFATIGPPWWGTTGGPSFLNFILKDVLQRLSGGGGRAMQLLPVKRFRWVHVAGGEQANSTTNAGSFGDLNS